MIDSSFFKDFPWPVPPQTNPDTLGKIFEYFKKFYEGKNGDKVITKGTETFFAKKRKKPSIPSRISNQFLADMVGNKRDRANYFQFIVDHTIRERLNSNRDPIYHLPDGVLTTERKEKLMADLDTINMSEEELKEAEKSIGVSVLTETVNTLESNIDIPSDFKIFCFLCTAFVLGSLDVIFAIREEDFRHTGDGLIKFLENVQKRIKAGQRVKTTEKKEISAKDSSENKPPKVPERNLTESRKSTNLPLDTTKADKSTSSDSPKDSTEKVSKEANTPLSVLIPVAKDKLAPKRDVVTGQLKFQKNECIFFPWMTWQEGYPLAVEEVKDHPERYKKVYLIDGSSEELKQLINGALYNVYDYDKELGSSNGGKRLTLNVSHLLAKNLIKRTDIDSTDGKCRRIFYAVDLTGNLKLANQGIPEVEVSIAGLEKLIPEIDGLCKVFVLLRTADDEFLGPFKLEQNKNGKLQVKLQQKNRPNFVIDVHKYITDMPRGSFLPCVFSFFIKSTRVADFIPDEQLLQIALKEIPKNLKDLGVASKTRKWADLLVPGKNSQLSKARIEKLQKILRNAEVAEKYQSQVVQSLTGLLGSKSHNDKLVLAVARAISENREAKSLIQPLLSSDKAVEHEPKKLQNEKTNWGDASQQLATFEEQLQKTAQSVASFAFEGQLTSKIIEAANSINEKNDKSLYKARIKVLRDVPLVDEKDLNKYLCSKLEEFRSYNKNEFVNIFTCIAQNFLTVFAGEPGSGKTSLCNYLATIFGLTNIKDQIPNVEKFWKNTSYANRYIPISVEHGWTTKRDFIGYFNPLTRTYESADPHRLECFRQLNEEANANPEFKALPYFLLLDEANLSYMEYYFADFMNICDSRDKQSFISIGGDSHFLIPDTLRFLATINNDHTTESLSPRLLDRTWIIQLPVTSPSRKVPKINPSGFTPINWETFQNVYNPEVDTANDKQLWGDIQKLDIEFTKLGKHISPRTQLAIYKYVSVAQRYMVKERKEDSRTPYQIALDYAVAQKLLPAINGSGDEYKSLLTDLKKSLSNEFSLTKSCGLIDVFTTNKDYFRFF